MSATTKPTETLEARIRALVAELRDESKDFSSLGNVYCKRRDADAYRCCEVRATMAAHHADKLEALLKL